MNSQLFDGLAAKAFRSESRVKYDSPKLIEYGKLSEITLAVGTSLTGDNLTRQNNKTHA